MKHQHDAQIRELFAAGVTFRAIAEATGLSIDAVHNRHRALGLPKRRTPARLDDRTRSFTVLMARAKCIGRVEFDDADLPTGDTGYIAFINSAPGMACATKVAALRSAIAAAGK